MGSKPSLTDSARDLEAGPGPYMAGAMLRQQREALGLDLTDVAAALRIKPAYLEALEAGRAGELPGAVYAIGFIRAYADHLGLDNREMLRLFKQQSTLLSKPNLAFPIPLGARSMPGGGMLLVALILAVCAYGGWFYLSTGDGPRPQRVAEVPLELLPYREPSRIPPTVSQPVEARAVPRPPAVPSSPTQTGPGSGAALLLLVRLWPRCRRRPIRHQTRRARSSSGLPPTAGFKSATLASRCFSRAF